MDPFNINFSQQKWVCSDLISKNGNLALWKKRRVMFFGKPILQIEASEVCLWGFMFSKWDLHILSYKIPISSYKIPFLHFWFFSIAWLGSAAWLALPWLGWVGLALQSALLCLASAANKPHKGIHKGGQAPKAPAHLCGGRRRPVVKNSISQKV